MPCARSALKRYLMTVFRVTPTGADAITRLHDCNACSNPRVRHTREVTAWPEPTYEELKARVAELEKQKTLGGLQFRVGDKGGVSVYGLGRFPVTLYYEQ